MLENLYTTKMSANKKTLQNRFTKIRSKNGRLSKIMALVMSVAIAVTFACATVVMAAVNNQEVGSEYGGAMYTYYAYPQENMDYNVNAALDIYNAKHSDALLYTNYSSVRYGYNSYERYFTPLCISNLSRYYLIDGDGNMLDIYNRQEPYYAVIKFWLPKDKELNSSWDLVESAEYKTMNISGKMLTVCYANNATEYKDDKVIEKMIEKQIQFELAYNNPYYDYDHNAYISEIIDKGVYVITSVFPKEKIQSWSCYGGHYGDFTEEAIISNNINNDIVQKNRSRTYFTDTILIPKNIDGNQSEKICEVTLNKNESLIVDVQRTTNKMPYINYKLVAKNGLPYYSALSNDGTKVKAGEAVEVFMMNVGGTRRNYLPFRNPDSVTYEIWVSGPESDYAALDIYTCKLSDDMGKETYYDIWTDLFAYKNPYGLTKLNSGDDIVWGN